LAVSLTVHGACFEKSGHIGNFYELQIKLAINKALITQKPNSFDTKWPKIDQKIIIGTKKFEFLTRKYFFWPKPIKRHQKKYFLDKNFNYWCLKWFLAYFQSFYTSFWRIVKCRLFSKRPKTIFLLCKNKLCHKGY
jgi:hypothetical protein